MDVYPIRIGSQVIEILSASFKNFHVNDSLKTTFFFVILS